MPTENRRAAVRRYYLKNKEKIAADNKRRHQTPAGLQSSREASARWRAKNPDRVKIASKAYRENNPEKTRAASKKWKANNKPKINAARAARVNARPALRIEYAMRQRVRGLIKKGFRAAKTLQLLGCSMENFLIYLESRFEPGMTFENYGPVWHVDHIMPCAIFDLTKPEHQKRCFHFSNLQPLFAPDNHSKGARVLSDQFNLL